MPPPSSRLKEGDSMKQVERSCFLRASFLDHALTIKMKAICSSETSLDFNEPYDVISKKIGPYTNTSVRASDSINSVALVREQTISTERSPLVGEVSANFC
jgi:hypothetical protein